MAGDRRRHGVDGGEGAPSRWRPSGWTNTWPVNLQTAEELVPVGCTEIMCSPGELEQYLGQINQIKGVGDGDLTVRPSSSIDPPRFSDGGDKAAECQKAPKGWTETYRYRTASLWRKRVSGGVAGLLKRAGGQHRRRISSLCRPLEAVAHPAPSNPPTWLRCSS
jgi:hypothetical protein